MKRISEALRSMVRQSGVGLGLGLSLLWMPGQAAFINNQNAKYVLGQNDFSSIVSAVDASHVGLPYAVLYVDDPFFGSERERLFVADSMYSRIMVFQNLTTNGAAASYVIGKDNFTDGIGAIPVSSMTLNYPAGLAYDYANHRLFVADYNFHRVLVFDMTRLRNGMSADFVLGQPDFTSSNPTGAGCLDITNTTNAHGLAHPHDVAFDQERQYLFVADRCNARVLVFDLHLGISDNMDAAFVIGHNNFTEASPSVSATTFSNPNGLSYDRTQQRLYVTDYNGNRVLIFDVSDASLATGMAANTVLGQRDFLNNDRTLTQDGLTLPTRTAFDPVSRRLFVDDYDNFRVLVFNLWGGAVNGMNAATVLGQPDFTTKNAVLTPAAMSFSMGLAYDATQRRLFVAGGPQRRVLIFYEDDLALTPRLCSADHRICGTVKAAEDSQLLAGIPIELRSSDGQLVTKRSDSSGAFEFDGLTPGDTYYVNPALSRAQSAFPMQAAVANLNRVGAMMNFIVQGVPGILKVTGTPAGSAVLLSTTDYTAANSPALGPTVAGSSGYFTAAVDTKGEAWLSLPAGSYYLTCWRTENLGDIPSYVRMPARNSSGPISISPNQRVSYSCRS